MVDTDEILIATHNRILFEIWMQEFGDLFDYTFQEGPKLNILNIYMIQSEHGISINQKDHIITNINK